MSKKLMVLWGVVIVLLLTAIYLIGYSRIDKEYKKFEDNLEKVTYSYLANKDLVPEFNSSQVVFVEDLINEEYIKDTESIKKYCVKSIVFSKGLIKDDYKIVKECEIDN